MIKEPIKFLGAYVKDVTINSGWSGENTTCAMEIYDEIPDPSGLPDGNGNIPDTGRVGKYLNDIYFQPPSLGTACMLTIKDDDLGSNFKFAGILKGYTYNENVNDGRKWNVELESPTAFLDGVQVILNGFNGTIYTSDDNIKQPNLKPIFKYGSYQSLDYHPSGTPVKNAYTPTNIINLFAYQENIKYGGSLRNPGDPNLGTTGGKFGGSDWNDMGYPVKDFITNIQACCKAGIFGGDLTYGSTDYKLDLSQLAEVFASVGDYRIKAESMSLRNIIEEVCQVAMCDYYIYIDSDESDPKNPVVADKLGVMKKAFIRVKPVIRKEPVDSDQIKNWIEELKNRPDRQKDLVYYSLGKEFTDQIASQKVIIGDKATRTWFASQDYMLPIWGSSGAGYKKTFYYGKNMSEYYNLFAPIRVVYDALDLSGENSYPVKPDSFIYFDTNMLELRCALSGQETWMLYHKLFALAYTQAKTNGYLDAFLSTYNYKSPLDLMGPVSNFLSIKELQAVFTGERTSHDMFDTTMDSAEIQLSYAFGTRNATINYLQRMMNTRYTVINKIASDYYGRQFLIAIPTEPGGAENNFRWIKFNQKRDNMWDLSKSAWSSQATTDVLTDPLFYDQGMGDLKPTVTYDRVEYDPVLAGSVLVNYRELSKNGGQTFAEISYTDNNKKQRPALISTGTDVDVDWGINYFEANKLPFLNSKKLQAGEEVKDSTGKTIETNHWYGFCKVKVPAVEIYDTVTTQVNAFGVLAKLIFRDDSIIGKGTKVGYHNMFGSDKIDGYGIKPAYLPPSYISIPQESTRYVWGPWWAFNSWDKPDPSGAREGRGGKVSFRQDSELKPQTYGSIDTMNTVAQKMCEAELIKAHASEKGAIELATAPLYNLFDRLNSTGPYITNMGISISDNKISTVYNFVNFTRLPGSLALYNLNRIKESQAAKFSIQKQIRELIRFNNNPPVNTANLKIAEEWYIKNINSSSSQGVFASLQKSLWRAANQPIPGTEDYEKFPSVSAHSSSTDGAMKAAGFSPEESFGSSYEQLYSPAYIWDQRYPEAHKELFNEGLLVTRGVGQEYATDGPYKGNEIPDLAK